MNPTLLQSQFGIEESELPYSKMVFPPTAINRLKYSLWRLYTPIHPLIRDCAVNLRIVTPPAKRQNYLVGTLSRGISIKDMIAHLVSNGYGNHFVAWDDEGQIVSLRKVIGFEYQYHVRIFFDGEVRAHYEYTPECYPILHYKGVNMEAREDEFLKLFGDKITPSPM